MKKGLISKYATFGLLLTVSILLSVGYANPAPSPASPAAAPKTAAPQTTAAPATTAQVAAPAPVKAIDLKLGHWVMPGNVFYVLFEAFIKEVKEKSKGQLTISMVPGLGSPQAHWDMLQQGALDFQLFLPMMHPGKFDLFEAFQLPFITSSVQSHIYASNDIIEKGLVDKSIYNDSVPLVWGISPANHIMTKGPKARVPTDLKGMKVRALGGVMTESLAKLECTPVTVIWAEQYTAIERGVVNALMTDYACVNDLKLDDHIRYIVELNACVTTHGLIMNKKRYESLSPELQKIIKEAAKNSLQAHFSQIDINEGKGRNAVLKRGGEVYVPTQGERQKWIDAFFPVWQDWIDRTEKKGLGGKQLLHEYGIAVKKYGGQWPYQY